jgi:phage-related protein
MLRRLLGLLLIVRGVTPFLIVAVIAIVGGLVIGDIQAATREPIQAIEAEFNTIRTNVDTLKSNVDIVVQKADAVVTEVQAFVATATTSINDAAQQVSDLVKPINTAISGIQSALNGVKSGLQAFVDAASSVWNVLKTGCNFIPGCPALPSIPAIPSLNLPDLLPDFGPAVHAIQTAFTPLQNIFSDFGPVVQGIQQMGATLQSLPERFNTITAQAGELLNGVRDVVGRWGSIFATAVIILVVLSIIYFVTPLIDNIRRGWRMLRGLSGD